MPTRRAFLKRAGLAGASVGMGPLAWAETSAPLYQGDLFHLPTPEGRSFHLPLEQVVFDCPPEADTFEVRDGRGNTYYRSESRRSAAFTVAGALGYHSVLLYDRQGGLLDRAAFPVDCTTFLADAAGRYTEFFDILYHTLFSSNYSTGKVVRYNGRFYRYYSSWFQDHVFVAEGMKYFLPDLKSGIELYADGQRADGLIWDNYKHPYPEKQSFWEYRFDYGGFTEVPDDPLSSALFVRIPVENIGEHTFLEGLYYAWKATGDDAWMAKLLDPALKAVRFATSSPWYWNEETQLLKRPFTIDRWDFLSQYDTEITGKDIMGADLARTRYGIMFGDNICLANGCRWLAEMLEAAGRPEEAAGMRVLSEGLWERIDALSWNGDFYQHWVPVENQQEVDFGVDTTRQVTLSNAMALLRGLPHDKAVRIISTYQGIGKEMPATAPGEWYLCYPPFERGWPNKWEYMNGGVSPIVAGDLALGAFEHGFESYGIDILDRLHALARENGHRLEGCYKGRMPAAPDRTFSVIDLKPYANTSLRVGDYPQAQSWPGDERADFRNLPTGPQRFEGVPFFVIPPDENQSRSCLAISGKDGFPDGLRIELGQKARSIYLLHCTNSNAVAGILHLHYADGSSHARYIQSGKEVGHYWYPKMEKSRKGIPATVIAWRGPAEVVKDIGLYAFGMDNPFPGKPLAAIELHNPGGQHWMVMGLTLSDGPHYFEPPLASTIPDHWAAAHVFKALMEGLAGVVSTGKAFERAALRPRWELAGVEQVEVTAKYVPSHSYLAYRYRKADADRWEIELATTASETEVALFVPPGKEVRQVLVDGESTDFEHQEVEKSVYAVFQLEGVKAFQVQMRTG